MYKSLLCPGRSKTKRIPSCLSDNKEVTGTCRDYRINHNVHEHAYQSCESALQEDASSFANGIIRTEHVDVFIPLNSFSYVRTRMCDDKRSKVLHFYFTLQPLKNGIRRSCKDWYQVRSIRPKMMFQDLKQLQKNQGGMIT